MPGTYGQQWTRYIRPGYSDQHMRVSDAERAEVTDRLAAHYSDGRLDRAEFDERVARAMSAKTRADLNGLLDDLPDLEGHGAGDTGPAAGGSPGAPGGVFGPTTPYRVGRRHRGNVRPILGIVLAAIIVSAAWHPFFHFFFFIPWFLVLALIAAVVFARRASGRARQDR